MSEMNNEVRGLSINHAIHTITALLRDAPEATVMVEGPPGMGKSDLAIQVGDNLDIPKSRQLIVHINNHQVVDFTGVPSVKDGYTVFNPTKMFAQFAEGTGPGLIVLEELPQASVHHQTWAAGFILERSTNMFKLDPEVRIICTGNRKQDKAGAKDLLTHLANRLYFVILESSIKDWSEWAVKNGVDHLGIAFLRLRPELLNDFKPERRVNPTERAWTQLLTQVPPGLGTTAYYALASGKVGEGAAKEWVATRDEMSKMPSVDAIRLSPREAPVPAELSTRYAVATALAFTTSPDAFEGDLTYIKRVGKEFEVLFVTDAMHKVPDMACSKAFIDWVLENDEVFQNTYS